MSKKDENSNNVILQHIHSYDVPPQSINPYNGYTGESIFNPPKRSTYYDYLADSQCLIPIRPIDEVLEDLKKAQKNNE